LYFLAKVSNLKFALLTDESRKATKEMVTAPLEYTISMTRANSHYFDVSLRIKFLAPSTGPMKLMMPVWTPGHYSIDDFPRNVLDVKAKKRRSANEWEETVIEKQTKNVWKVDWAGGTDVIQAEYSVHAFDYQDTKSYLDTAHAIINGASVFIYPVGMENDPITLKLVPYPGWEKTATGLEQPTRWECLARNIDELIDSPIEVGNQEIHSFLVQDVEHQVSLFGDAPVDREQFVEDIKRIVKSEVSIFGQIPYKKYVFIVNFTDADVGGLEHLTSTLCFVPRLRLIPREEYNLMLGLISHEFFHTWNVKRLRPKGLGPFNYSSETYTKSLWIAEGITSYYDDYVLRRVGIYTVPEYLDAFATNVNLMKLYPGSRWQSAEESSFDTWIKHRKGDANAPNVTMSYYTQGAVIGWMLDLQIRKNTRGQASLDNVMRKIYEETYAKDGRPYSDDEFETTAIELGGGMLKDIFDSRVKGREEVDFDRYLGYVGLRLGPIGASDIAKGFLGIRLNQNEVGKTIVSTRLADSPAEKMGLSVNDEIIGIDGLRLGLEKLSFYISNRKPGAKVTFLIARNGMLSEVPGQLGMKPPIEHRIEAFNDATDEQKYLFKNWLFEDWKPEIKYPEYTRSPDRKPVLDFV
jgi:predicted metalloprotease with PDZ domain